MPLCDALSALELHYQQKKKELHSVEFKEAREKVKELISLTQHAPLLLVPNRVQVARVSRHLPRHRVPHPLKAPQLPPLPHNDPP